MKTTRKPLHIKRDIKALQIRIEQVTQLQKTGTLTIAYMDLHFMQSKGLIGFVPQTKKELTLSCTDTETMLNSLVMDYEIRLEALQNELKIAQLND